MPNIHPEIAEEGIEGVVIETQSTLQTMVNSESMPETLFQLEPKVNSKSIDPYTFQVNNSSQPTDQSEIKTMSTSDTTLEASSVTNSETLIQTLMETEPCKTSATTSQVMLDSQQKNFEQTSTIKGQLISKCPFGALKSTKNLTKFL